MLQTPRIIAIDDEQEHIESLARGLNRYGTVCLPIHFIGEVPQIPECPLVRVIFADLHLNSGASGEHSQHFSILGGLIEETIKPSGPYLIILWTRYPDQAENLFQFLTERLQDVRKPFAVHALDKSLHLGVDPKNREQCAESIAAAIQEIVSQYPQIGALLNWEDRVLDAAADTVASVINLAESSERDSEGDEGIQRILRNMAVEAVGEEHVEGDRFRAVNEALMAVLGDRIASMHLREADQGLWQDAFGKKAQGLSENEAARLNRLLHFAPSTPDTDSTKRGAVIALPEQFSDEAFAKKFDLAQEKAAHSQFWNKKAHDQARWVLVQTQAACDHAQARPGPLPYHLGLLLLASELRKDGKPPAAIWRSPCFEWENQLRFLHVSARFPISLSKMEAQNKLVIFRLREQLLNDLTYQLHSHGGRPGMISFRFK